MKKTGKRLLLGRSKGYLHATGTQFRFILFLILGLISYTILLRVFQKLAEIMQLPIFLPISLIVLLIFIGIGGVLYSHTFVGPITRIGKVLQHMIEGDTSTTLRLRESDDPMLQDLAQEINLLCENSRTAHALVRDASRDLFKETSAIRESIHQGASKEELQKHFEELHKKQERLEQAIKGLGKP